MQPGETSTPDTVTGLFLEKYMAYKIYKLNTGEEVLGRVTAEGALYITLKDPFVVMTKWTQAGQLQMGLIPYFPFAKDNTINIPVNGYVTSCVPVDELVKEYTTKTSGILLP